MSRSSLVLALCFGAGCPDPSIELPKDAARPLSRPAAAVAYAADPAANVDGAKRDALEEATVPLATSELSGGAKRVSKSTLRDSVKPLLRGRALAHRVYEARFGPTASTDAPTAVVLTRGGQPPELGGFALSGGEQFAFPRLHDGNAPLARVAAIMFRDVDGDPDREVIALVAYADEDPEAPPYFSNIVLDWDAPRGRFVRLEQLEGEVEALHTAGEVLARLRTLRAEP